MSCSASEVRGFPEERLLKIDDQAISQIQHLWLDAQWCIRPALMNRMYEKEFVGSADVRPLAGPSSEPYVVISLWQLFGHWQLNMEIEGTRPARTIDGSTFFSLRMRDLHIINSLWLLEFLIHQVCRDHACV